MRDTARDAAIIAALLSRLRRQDCGENSEGERLYQFVVRVLERLAKVSRPVQGPVRRHNGSRSDQNMKKILVIGAGGAGKTTFARRLGEILGIDVVHLDSIYWRPGWIEPPKDEWANTVDGMLEHDAWIMDGNYSGTLAWRVEACDAVVFLDLPRNICLWRVIKRLVMYRNSTRPDMAEGCPEHLNLEFLMWIWNYPKRTRPGILRLLGEERNARKVVWLRTPAQIDRFLADARAIRECAAPL